MRPNLAAATLKATQRIALRAAGIGAAVGILLSTATQSTMAQGIYSSFGSYVAPTNTFTVYAPPSPQTPPTTYTLSFLGLDCLREGGGFVEGLLASDEPYVVIYAVDLKRASSGLVSRSNVFSDVDTGESRRQTLPVFGGVIENPDDLVVLVQVMENDESNVSRITEGLASSLNSRATSLVARGSGRAAIVDILRSEMARVIAENAARATLNDDDFIGSAQDMRITAAHLASAASGTTVIRKLDVFDGSDGDYRTYFDLRKN